MKYDFGGWATRNDLTCADGRVIKKDAFKGQNGMTVPLVWMRGTESQELLRIRLVPSHQFCGLITKSI